jgi:hypothetical protein
MQARAGRAVQRADSAQQRPALESMKVSEKDLLQPHR